MYRYKRNDEISNIITNKNMKVSDSHGCITKHLCIQISNINWIWQGENQFGVPKTLKIILKSSIQLN